MQLLIQLLDLPVGAVAMGPLRIPTPIGLKGAKRIHVMPRLPMGLRHAEQHLGIAPELIGARVALDGVGQPARSLRAAGLRRDLFSGGFLGLRTGLT